MEEKMKNLPWNKWDEINHKLGLLNPNTHFMRITTIDHKYYSICHPTHGEYTFICVEPYHEIGHFTGLPGLPLATIDVLEKPEVK